MTIGCEMNQILLRTLKRYILGEKMYYHRSNHDGYYNGYHDRYYNGYHYVVTKARKRTIIYLFTIDIKSRKKD